MAIGGMIGGGIFSVLGVTVDLAGHLAFASFLIGAAIAGLTARAYAKLAVHSGRSGGPFAYLREEGHPEAAAWVAWLPIAGYVFALSVYAFTFGHYLAHAVGGPPALAQIAGVAVLAALVAVNLRGVATSGLIEDAVVAVKLAILGGVSLVGIASFSSQRLTPLDDSGLLGVFLGAALIFVAYEGFELLPYDYDDIDNPRRTLPRALFISVGIVALVYVCVTLASQMLVPDSTLAARKEVAFALVGKEALGTFGLWAATIAAVFSTTSAINATIFSAARLIRDVSAAGELPHTLARERRGLPVTAVVVIRSLRRRLLPAAGNRRGRLLRLADLPLRLRPGQRHARPPHRLPGLGPGPRLPRQRRLLRGRGGAALRAGAIRPARPGPDRGLRPRDRRRAPRLPQAAGSELTGYRAMAG